MHGIVFAVLISHITHRNLKSTGNDIALNKRIYACTFSHVGMGFKQLPIFAAIFFLTHMMDTYDGDLLANAQNLYRETSAS